MRRNFWHNRVMILFAVTLLGGARVVAQAQTNNLPGAEAIVQQALSRAISNEVADITWFNTHYSYKRVRTWQYHNEAGKLTGVKIQETRENDLPTGRGTVQPMMRGRDLNLNEYPITNIVSRFEFTLIGVDKVNGRTAYVLDFVPRQNLPVDKFMDPFINHATGRVWIDQADHAISKGQFHLNSPVDVVKGLVGQVRQFSCSFSRGRTTEGCWFVERMEWHLDRRLGLVNRLIDYHEQRIDLQTIAVASKH